MWDSHITHFAKPNKLHLGKMLEESTSYIVFTNNHSLVEYYKSLHQVDHLEYYLLKIFLFHHMLNKLARIYGATFTYLASLGSPSAINITSTAHLAYPPSQCLGIPPSQIVDHLKYYLAPICL